MARTKKKTSEPKVTSERVGDVVRVTKVYEYPAEIAFDDLLDACVVEPDHDYGPPWEEQDGYEHDFVKHEYVPHEGYDRQAGWVSSRLSHREGVIFLKDDCRDVYDHYRAMGYSKQVAREKQAESQKHILERLVRYYTKGWFVFSVTCSFRGRHDSLHGIEVDDEYGDDPYIDEVKAEMADNVADELEQDGYTVTGRPNWPDPFNVWYNRVNGYGVTRGLITRERMRAYWEEHIRGKAHVLHELLHE